MKYTGVRFDELRTGIINDYNILGLSEYLHQCLLMHVVLTNLTNQIYRHFLDTLFK